MNPHNISPLPILVPEIDHAVVRFEVERGQYSTKSRI